MLKIQYKIKKKYRKIKNMQLQKFSEKLTGSGQANYKCYKQNLVADF